ncbi:MAG: response regulator [Geobacteraceae bacterium]|nr:MAG: response regulator [Geobacteraceae bacterium]
MPPTHRIALIAREQSLAGHLEIRLQSKGYQVMTLSNLSNVMGLIYSDPPDIIIIDLSTQDPGIRTVLTELKEDSYFSAIPAIGLLNESMATSFDWKRIPLDDFISLPISYPELFSRISLSLQRFQRVFDNNPLTRLPGNTSVQQAIEKVLGTPMAVCYVDINNFKPYNDVYGFSHGDEVLRMLARIMFNAIKESGGGFTGHIGGDDFVFIVPIDRAESVCTTIINNFSAIVADLFGDQEKSSGYYMSKNRKGRKEKFPLLSISIAIVPTNTPKIRHYGKVAEVAAELKKIAKKSIDSCYVIDKLKG